MNCSFSFLFMIVPLLKELNKVEPIPKPHLEKYNINSGNTNPNSRTGIRGPKHVHEASYLANEISKILLILSEGLDTGLFPSQVS